VLVHDADDVDDIQKLHGPGSGAEMDARIDDDGRINVVGTDSPKKVGNVHARTQTAMNLKTSHSKKNRHHFQSAAAAAADDDDDDDDDVVVVVSNCMPDKLSHRLPQQIQPTTH
jgi:hypothetical protein